MKPSTREWVAKAEEDFRYPGHNAGKPHGRRALADCKTIHREVRLSLGLPA
jgi:hypothetical protein